MLLMPVTTITPTTTIAMLKDPAGNTFGVLKAQPARPRKTTKRTSASKTTRKKSTAARGRKSTARPKKRTRRSR